MSTKIDDEQYTIYFQPRGLPAPIFISMKTEQHPPPIQDVFRNCHMAQTATLTTPNTVKRLLPATCYIQTKWNINPTPTLKQITRSTTPTVRQRNQHPSSITTTS